MGSKLGCLTFAAKLWKTEMTMSFLISLHSIYKSKHWSMDPYTQVYGTELPWEASNPLVFWN